MLVWGGKDFHKTFEDAEVILEGEDKDILEKAVQKIMVQCGHHVNSMIARYKLMHACAARTKTFTDFATERACNSAPD